MSPSLISALLLMLVGMITVFTILGIVVVGGQLLIRLTNRYITESTNKLAPESAGISERDVAIISAVVAEATRGRATNIKINKK